MSDIKPGVCGECGTWTCEHVDEALAALTRECERLRHGIWVEAPPCPRCGEPLTATLDTHGDWTCARHDSGKRLWWDYELVGILRARTEQAERERDEALEAAETTAPGRLWLAQRKKYRATLRRVESAVRSLREDGGLLEADYLDLRRALED